MFKNLSKIIWILIPVLLLNFLVFTLAQWTPPTGPPPTNNAPGPLNVGDTTQYKEGSLVVNALVESHLFSFVGNSSKPDCTEERRGDVFFKNTPEDMVYLCKWNGMEYEWEVLVE